jgi:hypothetical protein
MGIMGEEKILAKDELIAGLINIVFPQKVIKKSIVTRFIGLFHKCCPQSSQPSVYLNR